MAPLRSLLEIESAFDHIFSGYNRCNLAKASFQPEKATRLNLKFLIKFTSARGGHYWIFLQIHIKYIQNFWHLGSLSFDHFESNIRIHRTKFFIRSIVNCVYLGLKMIRAVGLREIAKQNSKQKQKKVVSVTASHYFKKRSRGCRWHIPLLPLKLKLLWEESAENLISALLNSKWEEENELFSFPLLLRYTTTTTNAIAKLFSPFFFFIPFPLENICIRISMYICS